MELPPQWQDILLWASVASLLAVVATIAAVPWVVGRLPADYFSRERREAWRRGEGVPLYARLIALLKNLLGFVLVVIGLIMLLTPGQGVLTVVAGLLVMNFPGKYRLERWLASRPGVLRGLNWLRARRGEPPLAAPREGGGRTDLYRH